ncbi:unnamed protein product [Prunus armeniaca]
MPRDGVSVYSPQGWYHAKVVLVPIGSFRKANNLYESRILEGSPLLEKPQIDFSEVYITQQTSSSTFK